MAPLDGKQKVSRGTDLYNHQKGYTNEELLKVQFTTGEVLSKNKGQNVSIDLLSSDTPTPEYPERGFFVQNKSLRNRK